MHAWTNLPFVRFSIFAIVGIIGQRWVPYLWESPVSVLSVLFLVFVCVRLFRYFVRIRGLYFVVGIVGLSLVSYTFGWVAKNHNELTDEDHWRHVKGKIIAIQGKVSSSVLEKENYFRYDLEVEQVLTENNRLSPVCGKIHFYIKREKTGYKILDLKEETPLAYGDVVQVYTTPRAIPPPSNPQEFDYSGYMALQNIHGQCFVSKGAYTVLANQPDNKILAASYQVREHLRVKIKDLILEDEARAIALALLIGVKDYLSDDIKRAYASAGAIHVLAVSGLHVGILYLLLLLVLKPWEKYKAGLWLISMTTVVAIWFYTFITGMSPSVLRAATMFTVFAISRALGRKNNGYNALGIAAFILLLYDPYLIYSVGFQLSFLAVGGIMYLQPCIYRWWIAPNAFLDKAWSITAVSLAAQMATFPLSVYYFNQFPTYFFISNFFVIPGASIIMIGGVLMILAEKAWSLAGGIVGMILTGVIQLMNFLVKSVEQIPGSLVTWLYIEGNEVLLTYGILILIFLGIHQRSSFYLNIGLSCLLILFGLGYCKQLDQGQNHEVIVYDIAGNTVVDWIRGSEAKLFVAKPQEINHEMFNFQINPFRRSSGLDPYNERMDSLKSLEGFDDKIRYGQIAGQRILVLEEMLTGYTIQQPVKADILIINNQSVLSADWLRKHFKFDKLIIGSDNSYYYSRDIVRELADHNITAHSLIIDGSFKMQIKSPAYQQAGPF